LNIFGFCILQSSEEGFGTLDLHSLFGGFVPHVFADAKGCVTIDPSAEQCSRNVRDTEVEHQPHTDEAYSNHPGSITTMRCEVAARSGGETILISAKAMYDAAAASLAPKHLAALFSPCLTVGRALPGLEEVQEAVIPIFSHLGDGRMAVRWRGRDPYLLSVTAEADTGYRFLADFVADPHNQIRLRLQPGQVIIIDNTALLHGRLPFPSHERRRYVRTNFYNNGSLCSELDLGFTA
jgi:alpha-ketoglutarate-dependent taurine dioxygenase